MAVMMHIILAALVFSGAVMPPAHAQLGGLGGLLSSLISTTGVVPCSIGGSISTSNVFPNATVQLRCGGNVIGSSTTNSNGAFQILGGVTGLLSSLLGSCNVVVLTPLVSCNVTLPSTGNLVAGLNPVGSLFGITNLVPGLFQLVQNPV